MNTDKANNIYQLEPREKPKTSALIREINRAVQMSGDFISNMQRAHDVRNCNWSGQTTDGRKGKDANGRLRGPWLGSSDVKVRTAEEIITENWLVLMLAFLRGQLSAVPQEMEDESKGQLAVALMKYYLTGGMLLEALTAVAAAADNREFFGFGVIKIGWKQTWHLAPRMVSLSDLVTWATELANEQALQFLAAQVPEETEVSPEDEAMIEAAVQQAGDDAAAAVTAAVVEKEGLRELAGWLEEYDDTMCPGESLRVARALQAGKMEVEYCAKEPQESRPQWSVRQMGVDLYVPPETGEGPDAGFVVESEWLTELQVRESAADEGWHKEWTKLKLARPGRAFAMSLTSSQGWFLQNAGVCMAIPEMERDQNLYQIVRVFYKAATKYGTVGVYETLVDDCAPDIYGLHRMVDWADGEYPFLFFKREIFQRLLYGSRGIALLVESDQALLKNMADSRQDLTSLTVAPPVKKHWKLAASQTTEIRPRGELLEKEGVATEFMRIGHDGAQNRSLQDEEFLTTRLRRAFGLMDEGVPDALTQAFMEVNSGIWLVGLTSLVQRTWSLVQRFMPVQMAIRVAGGPEVFAAAGGTELLQVSREEIQGRFDFKMVWNPTDLNIEWIKARAELVATLLIPLDTTGAVDRTPIIRMLLAWVDPRMAANVKSAQQASADETDDEQKALAIIAAGGEPRFHQGQNHQMRLTLLQELLQKSPRLQKLVRADPQFQAVLEARMKMHEQQVTQEANKQIGRDGAAYALGAQ